MSIKSILHGVARACTLSASTRARLNANPLAPVVKEFVGAELEKAISESLTHTLGKGENAAAVQEAISHAVEMTGVFK